MAREKRFHCPDCTAQGLSRPFATQSALEMHRKAKHVQPGPAAPVHVIEPLYDHWTGRTGEPEPLRRPHPIIGLTLALIVIALVGLVALAVLYRGDVADRLGLWFAGDPTATHE